MKIKLFLTDLEGTLLLKGQTVSKGNTQAVQDMVKSGVIFSIATGRMFQTSSSIAKSLGVDVPIITYNGALIKSSDGKIFYEKYLSSDIILKITEFCELNDWHLQNYSNDNLYYANRNEFSDLYEDAIAFKGEAVGWERMKSLTEKVLKLTIVTPNFDETLRRIEILKSKFGNQLEITTSKPKYVEIMLPNISKANAALILANKLKINLSEVMAIGDSYNDLPMLKAVGHSVAMGNAPDDVKNACEFVTENCEADGFAQAVYNYVLNEERKINE